MAANIPFQPMGPTVRITSGTASNQGNVVSINAVSPCQQYFVSNPDTSYGAFVAYGETANITAVIPNGEPANVVYIPPYSYKVFTGPQCSATKTIYARSIADTANVAIFVVPGEGQ